MMTNPETARLTLGEWAPEDARFWKTKGERVARSTLWITTTALALSFVTWYVWSAIAVRLPDAGFSLTLNQRFWLVALPGLVGATLRIPFSFLVPIYGTRKVVTAATGVLVIPMAGMGMAVQNPETPYWVLLLLAGMAGIGGGNFSAFMPSTSLFFPRSKQGTALGLQAGIGNLGVSVVQLSTPVLIGAGWLALDTPAQTLTVKQGTQQVWLQNAAFFWLIPLGAVALAAWFGLRDVPVRATVGEQCAIFRHKHTWLTTSLYLMTFGTFSGLAAAAGLLIAEIFDPRRFPDAPDPLAYAFLGPLVGSAMRPVGGYIADKIGGARVTLGALAALVGGVLVLSRFTQATSLEDFLPFLGALLFLFLASGLGNGSTYRMISAIFPAKEAAPVLGWVAAVAAYGSFLVPLLLGWSLSRWGSANPALTLLAVCYALNLLVVYHFYVRRGAEKPC